MRRPFIAVLVFTLTAASSVVAAPERTPAPEAVASARVSGTVLVISPGTAYSSATLRVAGPDGYEATAWSHGGDITLDLLADGRRARLLRPGDTGPPAERVETLPDGRYKYEMVLQTTSGEQFHTGQVQVDQSAAAAEVRHRAHSGEGLQGPPQGAAYEDNYLVIDDASKDGDTRILMYSRPPGGDYRETVILNDLGDIKFENFISGGFPRNPMTIELDGEVGIGSTMPQRKLHILDGAPGLRLEHTTSGQRWDLEATSTHFAMVNVTAGKFPFLIRDSGPTMHLTDGGVGINTGTPEQELHIVSSDGGDIRLSGSPQGESWQIATSSSGGQLTIHDANTGNSVVGLEMGAPQASIWVAPAGVGVGTSAPTAKLHVAGSFRATGDVTLGSSRTLKTGFGPVNPGEILARVADLPVTFWRYKKEHPDSRHIGPFAEDFQRLFRLGDGETISVIDAQGVALAAIKGLQQELADKEAKNLARDARIVELQAENAELESRLAAIEERLDRRR